MRNSKGQSLVEVVVGLAVMMIVVLSLVSVTTVSVRNASFSRNQMLATKYAQEWIEEARNLRNTLPESTFFVGGPPCDDGDQVGIFTRTRSCILSTNPTDPEKKTMTMEVIVSWSDDNGTHESKLTTELTNWK